MRWQFPTFHQPRQKNPEELEVEREEELERLRHDVLRTSVVDGEFAFKRQRLCFYQTAHTDGEPYSPGKALSKVLEEKPLQKSLVVRPLASAQRPSTSAAGPPPSSALCNGHETAAAEREWCLTRSTSSSAFPLHALGFRARFLLPLDAGRAAPASGQPPSAQPQVPMDWG